VFQYPEKGINDISPKAVSLSLTDTREFETPRLYNLLVDPGERENVLFPHTWVPRVALPQLKEHAASLKENPPIKPGTLDPYQPPK